MRSGGGEIMPLPADWPRSGRVKTGPKGPERWCPSAGQMTGRVIANLRAVVKDGDLRLHPMVAGLVDEEMRGRMQSSATQEAEV